MDRDRMVKQVEKLYAARKDGDFSAIEAILAPHSEFHYAGAETITRTFPGGTASSIEDVGKALFAQLEMLTLKRLETVVEDNKVAVMWDASFRLGQGEPFAALLYDLWEFDADGRIRKGTQFFDTALLVNQLSAAQA
jgi:ketosteroid isomerase-like protein